MRHYWELCYKMLSIKSILLCVIVIPILSVIAYYRYFNPTRENDEGILGKVLGSLFKAEQEHCEATNMHSRYDQAFFDKMQVTSTVESMKGMKVSDFPQWRDQVQLTGQWTKEEWHTLPNASLGRPTCTVTRLTARRNAALWRNWGRYPSWEKTPTARQSWTSYTVAHKSLLHWPPQIPRDQSRQTQLQAIL